MDVIEGCAPFVLTMTLEYSPEDTESLLGFKPQNGTNYYGLYDFPDKSYYYNIMRGMGTLIVNTLTRSINDDGFEIEKPTLMSVTELTSEKSAKSDEPLSTYKIEKSTDELLKQIKQTPLKEDALETAATVDEPTEKYPDIFGNPEVQKAVAEMKQKPSLFQRIKNWFVN